MNAVRVYHDAEFIQNYLGFMKGEKFKQVIVDWTNGEIIAIGYNGKTSKVCHFSPSQTPALTVLTPE